LIFNDSNASPVSLGGQQRSRDESYLPEAEDDEEEEEEASLDEGDHEVAAGDEEVTISNANLSSPVPKERTV
jgi:hypothetical protein